MLLFLTINALRIQLCLLSVGSSLLRIQLLLLGLASEALFIQLLLLGLATEFRTLVSCLWQAASTEVGHHAMFADEGTVTAHNCLRKTAWAYCLRKLFAVRSAMHTGFPNGEIATQTTRRRRYRVGR